MVKIIQNGENVCEPERCGLPPASGPESVRFAAMGDYGDNSDTQDVADLIDSFDPDFVLTLGDNNYSGSTADTDVDNQIGQYYHEYIGDYQGTFGKGAFDNQFFPSLGNHDWINGSVDWYTDYFRLPGRPGNTSGNQRYYNFKWRDLEFFAVSSDSNEPDGRKKDSTQAKWLENQLAVSDARFKVVYFHHAPFGSDSTHPEGENSELRWPFKKWGADVVLAGHHHLYERLEVDDFPYITVGTGGHSLRSGSDEDETLVKYHAKFGALIADANERALTLNFYNVDTELIDYLKIFSRFDATQRLPLQSGRTG